MGKFDRILFNSGNSRTRTIIASWCIRSGLREGFSVRRGMIDRHLDYDEKLSIIANNLNVLNLLNVPQPLQAAPEVWYSAAEAANAAAWRQGIDFEGNHRFVVGFFAGTSGGHPNQWFDDRFIAVADALTAHVGAIAVFFGGPKDADHAGHLAKRCRSAVSVAGTTSIRQLAANCALCDLVISLDTGGMHVAWAVGTPTVVLGHAANPKHIWLPESNINVRVIRKDEKVSCALCRKHACATRECMEEISSEEVVSVARAHFAQFPPSETARRARLARWIGSD